MKKNISELTEMVCLAHAVNAKLYANNIKIPPPIDDPRFFIEQEILGSEKFLIEEIVKAKNVAKILNVELQLNGALQLFNTPCVTSNRFSEDANKLKYFPIKDGETRFCMFPFSKMTTGRAGNNRFWSSYCCSQSAKHYFKPILFGEDESWIRIWNDSSYRDLRKALLTGEKLPVACLQCERSMSIDPIVFQIHALLHLQKVAPSQLLSDLIKKIAPLYLYYDKMLNQLGLKPLSLPNEVSR